MNFEKKKVNIHAIVHHTRRYKRKKVSRVVSGQPDTKESQFSDNSVHSVTKTTHSRGETTSKTE